MGYARHIGRVGALAITLGVGIALGSSPGVASAGPSNASATSGSSSSASASSPSAGPVSRGKKSADESSADAETAGNKPGRDHDSSKRSVRRNSADRQGATWSLTARASKHQEDSDDVESSAPADSRRSIGTPRAPKKNPTLIKVVSDVVSSLLQPGAAPAPDSPPTQAPVMLAALAAVRDERERNTLRRNATAAIPQAVTALADDTPNVLVIGVDGTNLSRILANTDNPNFFDLDPNRHHRRGEHRRAHHHLQPVVDGHPDRRVG